MNTETIKNILVTYSIKWYNIFKRGEYNADKIQKESCKIY